MVASITFDRFEGGIDWRRGVSVSPVNHLRDCQNAHITPGLAIQKRPGLVSVTTLEPGTQGLVAAFGQLHTFYGCGTLTHADSRFVAHKVACSAGEQPITRIGCAEVFNGALYIAAGYANGATQHHYLDGNEATVIADKVCPHTLTVIKAASKLFAVQGEVVRYCATGNPRDWSATNDAGFLPTGLNSYGDRTLHALGVYQNHLVAFSRDNTQLWQVDPDPSAMRLVTRLDNVGTHFAQTLATVNGDLFFLSEAGFRAITTHPPATVPIQHEVGSPIDACVRPLIGRTRVPRAIYDARHERYLCAFGQVVFVYAASARLAAWSRYVLPFEPDAWAALGGVLYLRHGDRIYRFSEDVHTDDGSPFDVVIEGPYWDFKSPGQLKRLISAEVILEGEARLSLAFDARQPDAVTPPIRVHGHTRTGGGLPLEVCGTEFSLRFRHTSDQPFRLDAVTLTLETLGAM